MASLAGKRNLKMQADMQAYGNRSENEGLHWLCSLQDSICQDAGIVCMCKESHTHPACSNSVPQAPPNSDPTKQQGLLKSQADDLGQNVHAYCPMDLDIVVKDDLSDFSGIDVVSDHQHNPMLAKHTKDLANALYVTDNVDTQSVDEMDLQDKEVFDISNVSSSDSGRGSENEDMDNDDTPLAGHWQNSRSEFQPIKPTTQPAKLLKRKPVLKLPILYSLVAEKLEQFPGHVHLHYHLDLDKAKAGVISIQMEGELKIFKDHMWNLLIPPLLANGKKSSHIMKKVLVYFEDAGCNGNMNKWQQAEPTPWQY
ncbi:hypothetical protein HD554DRAFT_2034779 [Boletus coccyginus]|nr:hypothetical protein HD554DRAFT_2034779 [Boletus coccyginus]